MKILFTIFLAGLLSYWPSAHAEPQATTDDFLKAFLKMSETQCYGKSPQTSALETSGRLIEAYALKSGHKLLCECVPSQLRKLQSTLPIKELKIKHSESSFTKQFLPQLIGPCGAEQLRATYSDGCSTRYAGIKPNSSQYCACMFKYASQLTDADAMQVGSDSSEYIPIAADAKKRGVPAPVQPESLKKFAAADSSCTAEPSK